MDLPVPVSDSPSKRTNKACCNCRRDKVRCDGERPCAACLRRGLTGDGDGCVDGCSPCRRSRARCDGGDPCDRCLELAIACVDEPADRKTSVDKHHRKSFPGSRAKLACQACRRDNKKCDNGRPCMRCISRKEKCIHVDRTPKVVKYRCVNCRRDNKKCEDSRPCRRCVEMNTDCIDKRPSDRSRVKMACDSCRRTKVQCDSERPCRACLRHGLQCILPFCTCAENGSELGHCMFCRSQRIGQDSQTPISSVTDSEESFSDVSGTPLPIASNSPRFADQTSFQVPSRTPSEHDYGYHVLSQDRTSIENPPASTDPKPLYTTSNSAQQQFTSHQQVGQGANLSWNVSASFSQRSQSNFTQGDQVWNDFLFQGFAVDSGTGLDNYFSRGQDMGARAHSNDSSCQAGPSSQFHQESSFFQLGSHTDGQVNSNNGVDFGIGTSEADSLANIGYMSYSCDPVPMPMPVFMPVFVPHTSRSHVHAGARNEGQMDMQPQLRRSAYYQTSDSRTSQTKTGPDFVGTTTSSASPL